MKTVIIGLGNPLLTDDGVGIKVARAIASAIDSPVVDVTEVYAGGIRLMEAMVGYDRAVVIDAMVTGVRSPWELCRMTPQDIVSTRNLFCSHDGPLEAALEVGRLCGLNLPSEVVVWGIEALDVENYSEELTADVSRAVPDVARRIIEDLKLGIVIKSDNL